ncbi:MAG: DNA primase [Anaerovoracaceae bacterium]
MTTYNKDNLIEEIKNRCNIVDVIGSVVTLKKAGNNYKGRCPFHNEKTPSFVVSPGKQIFTCFGCNATGDVIEFVRRYYNLEFKEALIRLAKEAGITITESYGNSKGRDELYQINKDAATFFFKALRSVDNPGIRYVISRGLTKETLHTFGIGYADSSWDSLYKFLKSKGYSEENMMKLGLISFSKGKYFDKFRNRVIFPIQNTSGKVIGFGGRALGDDTPKYLNSQETPIFHKKNNLYGLNISKNEIGKLDEAILVEGYMDVISLYQGGVKNVAASLGTALTNNQAKLLKRYTNNIVLSYDSDSAGAAAALRGSEILYSENLKVNIIHVTDFKDPDDYIKAKGKESFYNLVRNGQSYPEYRINIIKNKYNLDSTQDRVGFLKEVAGFLKSLSPVEGDIYISKVAKLSKISEGALRAEMGVGQDIEIPVKTEEKVEIDSNTNVMISKIEKNLIKIILTDSKFFEKVKISQDIFTSEIGKYIFTQIDKIYVKDEEIDLEKLLDDMDAEERIVLSDIINNIKIAGKIDEIYNECIKTYREEILTNKEKELIMRISIADEEENTEDIKRLTEELIKVQKARSLRG